MPLWLILTVVFAVIGALLCLAVLIMVTAIGVQWGLERLERWVEIRQEVREAERILNRARELDLDVSEILEREVPQARRS